MGAGTVGLSPTSHKEMCLLCLIMFFRFVKISSINRVFGAASDLMGGRACDVGRID